MVENLKRVISRIIIIALISAWTLVAHAVPINGDSLRFEVLLTSKMLNDIHLNETLINSIEITTNQLILLSTTDQFYLLGWGGIKPFGQKVVGNISSYAYTPDNLLMTIRNNELCSFDSTGNLFNFFKLPTEEMGISAGKYVMYIYDRNNNTTKHALYVIARGGLYAKLFEIPTSISSVVEMNNSLLFATGKALFSYNIKDKELKVLAALPEDKEIKSIAVDTSNNRIYFSTDRMVYALKDSNAVIISDQFGGVLRFFNDGLIVFNPKKKFLIRIVGIGDRIGSIKNPLKASANDKKKTDALTNSTIINLVKAKLSDDFIINLINSSRVNFNVSVDSMIFLSNQNVSSSVIKAMKYAMKSKIINSSNGNNTSINIITNNQTSQNNNTSNTINTIVKSFYIIAGSYPAEQQANDAIADLKRKGFPDAGAVGKNNYGSYRIAYKGYATNEEASKDLTKIKQTINPSAWIFEKK
jgi:hypothetical protein